MSVPDAPYQNPVVNRTTTLAAPVWLKWWTLVKQWLNVAPAVLGAVSLSGQSASIAATSIATPALEGGLYQVLVAHRVTTADNVASSLTVFATVTESGATRTYTGAANTSNAAGTGKSETFTVLIDAGTAIKYGTTYSTTGGAPAMQYRLTLRVVQIPSPL